MKYKSNVETCEEITPEEILNGTNQTIVEYWNGASDNLSQPFLLIGKEIRTDFNSLKKQIKIKGSLQIL